MQTKPIHRHRKRGDSTLLMALLIAAGLGSVAYYNVDRLNKTQRSDLQKMQRDNAEQNNISALSQATALMQYVGTSPSSDNAASLPYLYPDPYLSASDPNCTSTASPIGKVRNPGGSPNWTFSSMQLDVLSPSDQDVGGDGFDKVVSQGVTLPNNSKSTLKFLKAFRSSNTSTPCLIDRYQVEVSRSIKDKSGATKLVTNMATVAVPKIQPPKCVLSSKTGQKLFQPNSPMELKLTVFGVATGLKRPKTTTDLLADNPNQVPTETTLDIRSYATSISTGGKVLPTWTVTTPRPLLAVDSTSNVSFTSYVWLKGPAESDFSTSPTCSFTYEITPPATCKLWTDKATVKPGECVNITSSTLGKVKPGSLKLTAADATNQPVGGLTFSPGTGTGKFCTPINAYSGTVVASGGVPENLSKEYAGTLKGLKPVELEAVMNAMSNHVKFLKDKFPNDPSLQNLTLDQNNGIASLSNSQVDAIATLDFNTINELKTLTAEQITALRKPDNKNAILDLGITKLNSAPVLSKVNSSTLKKLETYDPTMLATYIKGTLDSLNVPADYAINGTVQDFNNATNTCVVHVTAGTNNCPLFGANFPNECRAQSLYIQHSGGAGTMDYTFCPGKSTKPGAYSSWEVAGIADTPATSYPCPVGSRCFALQGFEPRTPFVRVDNADSASCTVSTMNRINLGCFQKGTKILMADGRERPINTLKEGDMVFNPLKKKAYPIKRLQAGMERYPLIEISVGFSTVRVTRGHPFLTKAGIKTADQLRAGDEIAQADGSFLPISHLRHDNERPQDEVWNLELLTEHHSAEEHAIQADGIITGDLYLQENVGQRLSAVP